MVNFYGGFMRGIDMMNESGSFPPVAKTIRAYSFLFSFRRFFIFRVNTGETTPLRALSSRPLPVHFIYTASPKIPYVNRDRTNGLSRDSHLKGEGANLLVPSPLAGEG
jgi:hypothetical protein